MLGALRLRHSRGQAIAPCTPIGRTPAAVFFIVLFWGSSPIFFVVYGAAFAFFLALRGPWSLCFLTFSAVPSVRYAIGRGFFVSLSGRFCSSLSFVVGVFWLCFRLSMKYGYLSISFAYLRINYYLCSVIK